MNPRTLLVAIAALSPPLTACRPAAATDAGADVLYEDAVTVADSIARDAQVNNPDVIVQDTAVPADVTPDVVVATDAANVTDATVLDAATVDAAVPVDVATVVDAAAEAQVEGGAAGDLCNGEAPCGPGLLCCYPCGIPGCQNRCGEPQAGTDHCPFLP